MLLDHRSPVLGDPGEGEGPARRHEALVVEGLQGRDPAFALLDEGPDEVQAADGAVGERPTIALASERLDHERADDLRVPGSDLEHVREGTATGAPSEASHDDDERDSMEDPLEGRLGGPRQDAPDERGTSGVGLRSGVRAEVDPAVELVEALDLWVAVDGDRFEVPNVSMRDLPCNPDGPAAHGGQDESNVLSQTKGVPPAFADRVPASRR